MTPALKAMVEAMADELLRQSGEQREASVLHNPDGELGFYLQGMFDLEKVARAGLEAIRYPDDKFLELVFTSWDGRQADWERLLDAILTPTTGEGT